MTPLGKFLRVRSGLREGQRVDYPPLSPWVEREGRRKARERRDRVLDYALVFGIVWFAVVETLLAAWGWMGRPLP